MTIKIYKRDFSVHPFTRTRLPAGSVHVRDQSANEHLCHPESVDRQDHPRSTSTDCGGLELGTIIWTTVLFIYVGVRMSLVWGMLWIMGNIMDNGECYGYWICKFVYGLRIKS